MKPASAKAKGRRAQQSVRNDLIEMGINPLDILSTPMGVNGCDIYLAEAARKQFPFGIEVKNVEKLNVWQAWEQAKTNAAKEGLHPMLIMGRNDTLIRDKKGQFVAVKSDTLCVLNWDLVMKMVGKK